MFGAVYDNEGSLLFRQLATLVTAQPNMHSLDVRPTDLVPQLRLSARITLNNIMN